MLAYLSILGGRVPTREVAYGWVAVAAVCGGLCGVRWPKSAILGAALSGLFGIAIMAGLLTALGQPITSYLAFDVFSAGVVGVLLRLLIEIIAWFEIQSGQPRSVTAAWLTLSVIIGNWFTP
jgi:hypothetical protein